MVSEGNQVGSIMKTSLLLVCGDTKHIPEQQVKTYNHLAHLSCSFGSHET